MDLHTRRIGTWRRTFRLGDQCQQNAQKGADADRCGNSPADSQDGRRGRVKQGRMPNREVFDAEAGRDLIVYDAVGDCGDGAEQNDLRFADGAAIRFAFWCACGWFHDSAWPLPLAFTKNFQLFHSRPRCPASGRQDGFAATDY